MALHSTLSGTDLHESKGADSASAHAVAVADGSGSAAWGLITSASLDSTVLALLNAVNSQQLNVAVTPFAGGGASGTQLLPGLTLVNAPATTGDSLQLPNAAVGVSLRLFRKANTTLTDNCPVYVKNGSGDTILGLTDFIDWTDAATGDNPTVPLEFWCISVGNWFTNGKTD